MSGFVDVGDATAEASSDHTLLQAVCDPLWRLTCDHIHVGVDEDVNSSLHRTVVEEVPVVDCSQEGDNSDWVFRDELLKFRGADSEGTVSVSFVFVGECFLLSFHLVD